jgi:predicted RNA binding protein YcfA (HicA-like mRNA interferase family)
VKRRELLRHLRSHGCELLREGGNHSVFVNRAAKRSTAIPRHREINDFLARKICKDLAIPDPFAR